MYSQVGEINKRKETIKQKIRNFNELMKEISEDLTSIIMEHKEKEFHEALSAMLRSLDKAQTTVRQAYNLFFSRKIDDN